MKMFVKALSLQTKLKKHEYSKTVTNSHIYFQVSLVSESIDDPEPILPSCFCNSICWYWFCYVLSALLWLLAFFVMVILTKHTFLVMLLA